MNKSLILSLVLLATGLLGFFYFLDLGITSQESCMAMNNCGGPEGLQILGSFLFALPIFLIGLLLFWFSISSRKDLFYSRAYSLAGGIIGLFISFVVSVVIGWKFPLGAPLSFLIIPVGIGIGISIGGKRGTGKPY